MLKEKRTGVNCREYVKNKKVHIPTKNKISIIHDFDGITQLDISLKIAISEQIQNLDIISFRMPLKAIYLIEDAVKRKLINNVEYYLSDSIPQMVSSVDKYLKNKKVYYDNFHAKMTLIKTKQNFYVIQSSGNFHFELDIESTTIHNDENLYICLKKWLEDIKT